MPGFDPNEPRDAIGRWTASIKSKLQAAASDKETGTAPGDKGETLPGGFTMDDFNKEHGYGKYAPVEDVAVTTLTEQSLSTLLHTSDVRLDGLTPAENMDVLTVFKDDVGANGVTPDMMKIGVKTYGTGLEFQSLNPNDTALAAYVYNARDDVGGMELYLNRIHDFANKKYVPESWDDKIRKVKEGLQVSTESFNNADEFAKMLNQDSFNKFVKEANRKIDQYTKWKAEGRESKPFTIPNSIDDKDKRFQAMMYHELGHMRLRDAFNKEHKSLHYREETYTKWKETHMRAEMDKNPISDYGGTNPDEYFAENYAAHKLGLPISAGMEKFIKSLKLK